MTSSDVIIRTQRTLPEVLAEINGQLVQINTRLDGIEKQQDNYERAADKRLDAISLQLSRIEGNQLLLSGRLDNLDSKVDFAMWVIGICFAAMAILVVVAPSIRRFCQKVFPPMPDSQSPHG